MTAIDLSKMPERMYGQGTCPRCDAREELLFALSRWDNKTYLCDPCGTAEALIQAEAGHAALDPVLGLVPWVQLAAGNNDREGSG